MEGISVVALSGGVDSSTTAALLAERGERVVGLFMRLYNAEGSSASVGGRCCGSRDLEDARSVCAKLDIPFYVVNYQAQFQSVIDDFVESYARGETPSPCVRCNERIKFLPLLHRARALGATRLYTGHYARIRNSNGCPGLYRARDLGKDQSYFLFGMPRDSLTFVDFPLGDMTKTEVRAEARRLGLPNADKPDSQEICFIPDGRYSEFVASRIPAAAGDIVDVDSGAVVGTHEGIHNFTIGQRKGLGGSFGQPRYVVSIDALTRVVRVGARSALQIHRVRVNNVRWLITDPEIGTEIEADVQIRSRHKPQSAQLLIEADGVSLQFQEPVLAPAPGQAAVFYGHDSQVLGGGFIAPGR